MFRVLMIAAICLSAGCSAYDWTALTADAVAAVLDAEDKDSHALWTEDGDSFWDPNVSTCIRSEKKARNLDQQLDAMFNAVEAGNDYIILPNGERYLVGRGSVDYIERSPTADCIGRHSD